MTSLTTLDRYLFRMSAGRVVGLTLVIVTILTLENLPRLVDRLDVVGSRADLVERSIVSLLPEFAATAVPLALFLAVAFLFRSLALRAELDALMATGAGPIRLLRMPFLLGLLCTALVIGIGGFLEPRGERNLDRIGEEAGKGAFGIAIPNGEPTDIGHGTTIYFDSLSSERDVVHGLVMHKDRFTVTAREARIRWLQGNQMSLLLRDGYVSWNSRKGPKAMGFGSYRLSVRVQPRYVRHAKPLRDRLQRLDYAQLARAMERPRPGIPPEAALASLSSRLASACLCLLLPIMALPLSVPPKRSRSAGGIGAGLILILVFWRLSALAEDRLRGAAPIGHLLLLSLFAAGSIWFLFLSYRHGFGRLELVFERGAKICRRLWKGRRAVVTITRPGVPPLQRTTSFRLPERNLVLPISLSDHASAPG